MEQSIGSQIKEWRKKRGYKQNEFAEKIGIAAQNLSYYESGKRTLSMDTLRIICNALEVDIALVEKVSVSAES